jgi:hypothetical protein
MTKFSLSSWLAPKNNATSDVERKRQNRRTFSGFSPAAEQVNEAAPAEAPYGKPEQASGSTSEATCNVAADTSQPPVSATANMVALSHKIARETEKLEAYMKENGLAMPSFNVDAADDFPTLPEDIQRSRLEVIHATKELRDLAVGPRESVRWGVWEVS